MRLLNTSTLVVEEFFSDKVPEYVILSHTWEEEEVTLQDIRSGEAPEKKGYPKLQGCCQKALSDGFDFCWIDTCCIDKTSGSELSEAINSMYKWYAASAICYVYLPDVTESFGALFPNEITRYRNFDSARWFKRGWTLQELIAPAVVEFYDDSWKLIGTRFSLREQSARNTGIDRGVLEGKSPSTCTVAVRMSWAAHRETTRIEDEAYSLLGLFGVNMPLLYGEGRQAFRRLQEEILRVEEDYTIFVWSTTIPNNWSTAYPTQGHYRTNIGGMLAPKPSDFGQVVARTIWTSSLHDHWSPDRLSTDPFAYLPESEDHLPPHLTSRGVRLSLPLTRGESARDYWACITMIFTAQNEWHMLCVRLQHVEGSDDRYQRILGIPPILVPKTSIGSFRRKMIYVAQPVHHEVSIRHFKTQQDPSMFGLNWLPRLVNVQTRTMNEEVMECSAPQLLSLYQLQNPVESINDKFLNYGEHLSNLKLAEVLHSATETALQQLSMHSDTSTCYIMRRGIVAWLVFRVRVLHIAFLVRVYMEDEGPLCSVSTMETDLYDDLQDNLFKPFTVRGTETVKSDCVALDATVAGSSATVRISVNIRQIASAIGLSRYVLSVEVA